MVDSKKYNGSQWEHSLRKLTTATEAVENPLYSDGTAITAYTIKGNTVQNGTPTPSNPVDVVGVGEIDNIFEGNIEQGGYSSGNPYTAQNRVRSDTMILTQPNVRYYMNFTGLADRFTIIQYTTNGTYSKDIGSYLNAGDSFVFSSAWKLKFVFRNSGNTNISPSDVSNISLSHGYKIPISSAGVTTNLYLGSTQTVRQIKKIVFDGTQSIYSCVRTTDSQNYCCAFRFSEIGMTDIKDYDAAMAGIDYPIFISDRFVNKDSDKRPLYNNISAGEIGANSTDYAGNRCIIFCVSGLTTADDYIEWFTNNPTELYYILETPTTGIVNEPLMKIGTYADTLSNVAQIPTTEGANSITVGTTVQPSEFTATWTGWHNAMVKEWDGSQWN